MGSPTSWGFVVSWRIVTLEGAVYETTILSGMMDLRDVGTGIRPVLAR
jgi:hypothetical protein